MVDSSESEIVEVDSEVDGEENLINDAQKVIHEDEKKPTRGQAASGAGGENGGGAGDENGVRAGGGNGVGAGGGNGVGAGGGNGVGAQGVPKTFFTWLVGLFAGDTLPNHSEQEALLGNLNSLFCGEIPLSVVPAGENGVGVGVGENGVGVGVGAPGGGLFRRIWGSRHREGPNGVESGSAAPEATAPVAPGGGWFRKIWGSRHREGSNDIESGSAPVPPIAVSVVKDSWDEFLGEANEFIKWIIMECFLFVPVKYLLKGEVPSKLSLSAFQLQLPTLFLPTVFTYVTCILASKMFRSSKIKTIFQVFGILLGVAACLEAFYFVGYDAHISVTIVMAVILVAIIIAKFCD